MIFFGHGSRGVLHCGSVWDVSAFKLTDSIYLWLHSSSSDMIFRLHRKVNSTTSSNRTTSTWLKRSSALMSLSTEMISRYADTSVTRPYFEAKFVQNIDVAEVKVVKGSEAFHEAKVQEPPKLLHPQSQLLFLCVLVGFCCQTMNGFDGSLFGGLTANKKFLAFFHGSADGSWAALVSAMYQIGSIVALPFVGPCIDSWGRRTGMFIGSIVVVVGTVICGTTVNNGSVGQFMGGRFLLGFGVAIASAAGPIYVVEMAHPAFRGIATAYANTMWFVGSILAAGSVLGALPLGGKLSWQIPVWLQMVFAGIICLCSFIIPESPRWLYVNGKKDQAREVLAKWHGHGNVESPWVKLQLQEYEGYLNLEGETKSLMEQTHSYTDGI